MIHGIISAAWCVLFLALGTGSAIFFLPFAFYLGREFAQAEYRYIEAHGGIRSKCSPLCGFCPSAWTAKALLDFLLPLAVALASTLLAHMA